MINYITGYNRLVDYDNIITPSIGSLMRTLEFSEHKIIGLDIEATGKHHRYITPLLLGLKLHENPDHYIIDLVTIPKKDVCALLNYIENNDYTVVGHNLSFDLSILYFHYGILFTNVWCTMVADQVLYNGVDSIKFGYAELVRRYFHKYLNKAEVESFIDRDTSEPFKESEILYLINDIEYLIPLRQKQQLDMSKKELEETIALENRFLPKKVKMESYGIAIDHKTWRKLAKENQTLKTVADKRMRVELVKMDEQYDFTHKLDMFTQSAQMDLFSPEAQSVRDINIGLVNFNSPKQLLTILNTCGGNFQSTRLEILQQKLRDNPDESYTKFLELLIEYRGLEKATSTYGEGFLQRLDQLTGKIHTNFTQAFTTTGRLSSASYEVRPGVTEGVNLQNIKAEAKYRNCFIADAGRELVTADYGGQEIALAAWQSQDPLLLSAVRDGLDIHSKLATESFRIITGDDELIVSKTHNPQYRKVHKNVLFALFYGAGAARIADVLDISIDTADKIYDRIRQLLSKLMEYQDNIKSNILSEYSVRDHSYTNRVRYFERLFDGKMSLHKAEKEASNFPIQSSGASMIKLAICEMDDFFMENGYDANILFTVHDEIIVDIPEGSGLQSHVSAIMQMTGKKFLGDLPVTVEAVTLPYWTK